MLLLKTWHRAALIVVCAGLGVAFLGWLVVHDPGISFLRRDRRAEWILFPSALQARAHGIVNLDTLFRRVFTLDNQPRAAQLTVRAAKRIDLKINGAQVQLGPSSNWKKVSTTDVLALLRTGTNTIEARVFNADAPPALWLSLRTDQVTLRSDQMWEASFTGSAWRSAVLASASRLPRAGNLIAGAERTFDSVAKIWPIWLAFGGIALSSCSGTIQDYYPSTSVSMCDLTSSTSSTFRNAEHCLCQTKVTRCSSHLSIMFCPPRRSPRAV